MPEETKKRGGGPKTPEGKARASQNSTKHGMCTRHRLVLEDETLDDYNRHYDGWLYDFPTESFTQRELLEQVILNAWLMKRATRRGIDLEATVSSNPADWTAEQEHKLELMQRYKGAAERAFYRSLAVLRQLDKDLVRHDLLVKKLNSEITELEKKAAMQAPPTPAPEARAKSCPAGGKKKKEKLAVIEQWVEVDRNAAGETVTKRFPSDEDLKKEAAKMEREPDLVYRRLFFVGAVPEEYRWATSNPQGLAFGGLGMQRMTWAKWKEQIVQEMITVKNHVQPCPNLPRPKERGGCECEVCTANEWMLAEAGLE